jgi:hypothetical protein
MQIDNLKIEKSLGKSLERSLTYAYHRFTEEKGLEFGKRFWEAVANDPKLIVEIGKLILAKSMPTLTAHKGDPLTSVSNSLFVQSVVQKAKELQPKEPVANRRFETDDTGKSHKL